MRNLYHILLPVFVGIFSSFAAENFLYVNDFTQLDFGAKPAAMRGAVVCSQGDVAYSFYNPAGLSSIPNSQFLLMHASQFASEATYDLGATAFSIQQNINIGVGYIRSVVNNIKTTQDLQRTETGVPIYDLNRFRMISPSDHILFLAAGKPVSKRVALGASVKLYYRTLTENNSGYGLSADAGFLWKMTPAFTLGMALKGLTTTYITWRTGTNEFSYPEVVSGISYNRNIPYFYGDFRFSYQIGAQEPKLQKYRDSTPSLLEVLKTGVGSAEYVFNKTFALRAGIDEVYSFTTGTGITLRKENIKNYFITSFMKKLRLKEFSLDYAFLKHPDLYSSHLVSMSVGW
jgi:hypothetical protein